MTENEAIIELHKIRPRGSIIPQKRAEALDVAIQAIEKQSMVNEILHELREYSAIGTIEELQALKEKNTPKELAEHNFQDEVHHYLCPSCRNIVSCTQNYCEECGQALEV